MILAASVEQAYHSTLKVSSKDEIISGTAKYCMSASMTASLTSCLFAGSIKSCLFAVSHAKFTL